MIKKIYVDTETSGLNPDTDALLEIGGLICIEGQQNEEFELFAKPFDGDRITDEALKVNGKTHEEIAIYQPPRAMHSRFTEMLSMYVDKFNKKDKFFIYGWNSDFDDRFLRAFFRKCGDRYYGSYFLWPSINVAALVTHYLNKTRFSIDDFHLHTVAEWFAIPVDYEARHGALYDAILTKQVLDALEKHITKR